MWKLDIKNYGCGSSKEIKISRRVVQLGRWLQVSGLLHAGGFLLGLHRQDETLLLVLLLTAVVLTLLKFHYRVKEESILLIHALGVRVTTKYASGRTSSSFYEMTRIKDLVINEGITMQRILFYFAILVEDPRQPGHVIGLVPLFMNSLPRLRVLKVLYNEAQSVLWPLTYQAHCTTGCGVMHRGAKEKSQCQEQVTES